MKLFVLTAIIAAVASTPLTETVKWPWQVGKEYVYNVDSYTWAKFEQSNSSGNAFKAQFIVRVLEPGRLVAKIESPLYAHVQGQIFLSQDTWPTGLNYNPVQDLGHPFEILVDGGRVVSVKVPTSLSLSYENLLKGLISALQVDLSTYKHLDTFPNSFDKETFQGLFKKMEADVTGDCATLYSISPVSAEWRRELPAFAEDPIQITKSKNYGHCVKNVGYNFGIPEGAKWKGIAYHDDERQFIKHTSESRIYVGKQGTIYKSETLSSVFVNPLLYGKQKAEVYSYVSFYLTTVQPESSNDWEKSVEYRTVESLLFTYNESALVKGDKNIADAQKLLQDMTPLLQDPNNLPKADFLTKFNMLVRSIMFMNSTQLTQMTTSIEVAKSSKNYAKNNMWIIYRDAVAQAGTVAAFKEIKSWILTKKIEGNDAAEVISSMASVLRFPNKEIMNDFFVFVMSPEVQEQKNLNTTALLAVSKFISFGYESSFVSETVIPRLYQELKQAIEKEDKNKAQVYVRVLGNLAHPNILKVFAPYLEGQIPVSKYLRTQMVLSLKTLANTNTKNDFVRSVLFSILKNTAEPYEVRVAAALNIFMAYPTQEMMQIMAHMTNGDPSTQVRAVLANGITFAANLKDPRFSILAKTAKSVLYLVSKEKYGNRYSTDSLIDEYTDDDELAHFREVSFIGSENYFLPVYQRGALRFRGTGLTEEDWFTLSVSDMQHFMDYVTGTFLHEPMKTEDVFKFSAKKISEMLNLKPEHRCYLEGSFFLNMWNQQMLLTFTEDDVKSFLSDYINEVQQKALEKSYNYTKILTQKQVFVTFPLAMGMPFMFDYSEPTAFILQNKLKAVVGQDAAVNLNFTYARNLDGSVGFLDTLGDVYAGAGIINKFQLYLPVRLEVPRISSLSFSLKMEKNANLIHMSVWPYTTLQKKDSLLTVFENPSTKFIERPQKVVQFDAEFGLFEFKGYSYSSDFMDSSTIFDADILTSLRNLLYQKDVALTRFDMKNLDYETKINFSAFYDNIYKLEEDEDEIYDEEEKMEPATLMNDVTPNSKARRLEIYKRAKAGMPSPQVQLLDISIALEGIKKVEYVFTGAIANTFQNTRTQAVLFFNGLDQFNAVFRMIKPKTAALNFEEALKNEIKVLYEADFKIGKYDNIHFEGFGERSKKYTEMLSNDPLAKQCLQETSKHNFFQKDCYKMIIKAHAPDYFKGKLIYKEIKNSDLELAYNLYKDVYDSDSTSVYSVKKIHNQLYPSKVGEDMKTSKDVNGTLEFEAQAFYYDNYINYEIKTEYGELNFNHVEGLPYYPYAMAFYAPLTSWERARNWFTDYQYLPYCAVDDNKIWTFSGRSYDYNLTSPWHVVMVDEAKSFTNDLVILMSRPSDHEAELYVSFKSVTSKAFEMHLTSKTIEVITNVTKVSDNGITTYFDGEFRAPLLQYYTVSPDTEFYSINDGAVRFMFDAHRLVIFTDDHRSTTRGLCGRSSTEIRDDYMTPYGLVDRPELYGASFSLDESDPKTVELKNEAKLKAYQPVTKYTNILRSDSDWSKTENESAKGI